MSFRALGREIGVSDTAVRKKAKRDCWQRLALPEALREPKSEPTREPAATRSEARAKSISTASVKDLTDRGRNIILAQRHKDEEAPGGAISEGFLHRQDWVHPPTQRPSLSQSRYLIVCTMWQRCVVSVILFRLKAAAPMTL